MYKRQPESSAGSLMTTEYVRLREDMTVAQAFEAIRKQGENAETVYTCYVVKRNRLKGVVSARSLLLSEPVSYTHLDVYKRQGSAQGALHSGYHR